MSEQQRARVEDLVGPAEEMTRKAAEGVQGGSLNFTQVTYVAGGGVPGMSVEGGGVPGKPIEIYQGGGVPGRTLLP
jgi:hypothetical protein